MDDAVRPIDDVAVAERVERVLGARQLAARDLGVPHQRPGLAIEGQQMHALVGSLSRQVNPFAHDDR